MDKLRKKLFRLLRELSEASKGKSAHP